MNRCFYGSVFFSCESQKYSKLLEIKKENEMENQVLVTYATKYGCFLVDPPAKEIR